MVWRWWSFASSFQPIGRQVVRRVQSARCVDAHRRRSIDSTSAIGGGDWQRTATRGDPNRGETHHGRRMRAMKPPKRLQPLIEEGLIDTVVRQLMSGKEAMVYVVRCGDDTRCAKVYKEATHRSFRQAVDYTENRKVKNTRQARAMAKGTRF